MAGIPVTDITETDIEVSDQMLAFNSTTSKAPTIQSFFNQAYEKLTAKASLSSSDKILIAHDNIVYAGTLENIIKSITQSVISGATGLPVSDSAVTTALGDYTKDDATLSSLDTTSKKPVNSSAVSGALSEYQKVKKISLSANQTLTLTHTTSIFAVKITIQSGNGYRYGCLQYQGYGNGTYDHIFELLKGSSFEYTMENNTLSFTVTTTTRVLIEYLLGDDTSIVDTIS